MEWGDSSLQDVMQYSYRQVNYVPPNLGSCTTSEDVIETTLADQIQVQPGQENAPILVLGCGNSQFGEELHQVGYKNIIQTDVSKRVVESMSQRCGNLPGMTLLQDDATELSAFHSDTIHAVIDKGLVDALYCADEYEQCHQVLAAVQRVLKPDGGVFLTYSYSRPDYFLPVLHDNQSNTTRQLNPMSLEIQQLDRILLYKYTMKESSTSGTSISANYRSKKKKRKQGTKGQ